MNDRKYLIAAIVVAVIGFSAVRFMVSPLHARADRINAAHASLLERISGWPGEEALLAPLRNEIQNRRSLIAREQRPVPGQPDLAGLIRRLSLEIDGKHVIDQTFVAGRRGPAATGAPEHWRSVPLTVELVSDFPTLFALVQKIEETSEPVRVTKITIERLKGEEFGSMARTVLVLDAIHQVEEESK